MDKQDATDLARTILSLDSGDFANDMREKFVKYAVQRGFHDDEVKKYAKALWDQIQKMLESLIENPIE